MGTTGTRLAWARVVVTAWCLAAAAGSVRAAPPVVDRFAEARERMVRDDIAGGGVTDPRVLESMRLAPRHDSYGHSKSFEATCI